MKPFRPARLVIIGPSGAGKGTQAKLIEKKFGWKHISSGELFRQEIKKQTALGRQIEDLINRGIFVSTELTFTVLKPVLDQWWDKGFILDGFPRLPDQPPILDEYLADKGATLDIVFYLRVSSKVVLARVKEKWARGERFQPGRSDETLEAIKNRLAWSKKTLDSIVNYYRQQGILAEIDGERPIEPIHQDIVKLIKEQIFQL